MPPPLELALAAVIVFAAATLQAAVGFGMGLVTVSLLVLLGWTVPEAVATSAGAAFVQTAYGVYTTREHVPWRTALATSSLQWLTLPLGVAAMAWLDRADPAVIKQSVGVLVLVLVTSRLVVKPAPRESVAAIWAVLAGVTSGLLAGFIGMGGPPIAFFALAHDWDKDRFRAYLWSQFLLLTPLLVVALTWRFGGSMLQFFAVGVVTAPLLAIATKVGLALTRRWERAHLQRATTALLYAIGLSAAAAPLIHG